MRTALRSKFLPPFRGGVAPDSLLTGLESYWTLDELSGVRADSVGANDLTDNNTVTYVNDGPRGVNAKFVRTSSESLSHIDDPTLRVGVGDFSWVLWYKPDDTIDCAIVNKNQTEYTIDVSGGLLRFYTSNGGAYPIASMTAPIAGEWHFIAAWRDGTAQKLYLQLDSNTPAEVATGAIVSGDSAVQLDIGVYAAAWYNGLIGRIGFFKKALSAPERAELFNSGRGKSYADLSAGIKTNLVSYWNLDEVSNGAGAVTRNDSHGANDLTDNNTVTSLNTGPEQVVASFVAANSESLTSAIAPGANNVTAALWFYYDGNFPTFDGLFKIATADAYSAATSQIDIYGYGVNHLVIEVGTDSGSSSSIDSVLDVSPGWIFVVAVCDKSVSPPRLKYSLNGVPLTTIGSAVSGNPIVADRVAVGRIGTAANHYSDSKEAVVGVWSTELSDATIATLFNSGVAKKYSELTAGEKTNLVSYWNLTEVSGNRSDSHGANTLTDNNTVLSVINMSDVADKISAKFDSAFGEYLSHIAVVSPPEWTIAVWAYIPTGIPAGSGIYARVNAWAANVNCAIYGPNAGDMWALVGDGVNFYNAAKAPVLDSWNLLIAWYDSSTKKVYLSINDGTAGESLALVGNLYVGNTTIEVGAVTAIAAYWDSNLDETIYWSRVLTAPERTRLFNLGKGYFYPFVP